jgi:hypothetical protein
MRGVIDPAQANGGRCPTSRGEPKRAPSSPATASSIPRATERAMPPWSRARSRASTPPRDTRVTPAKAAVITYMATASPRSEAVRAYHAATRAGPKSVPAGATAASTSDPARTAPPAPPRASPPADPAAGGTRQYQAEPEGGADEQRGAHILALPESRVRAAAAGCEEVRVGLAMEDRPPAVLRCAGAAPGREGHGAPQVK